MKNIYLSAKAGITTIALCLMFMTYSTDASGQTTSWIGNTTNWKTSSNWTNGVPDRNTNAIIGDANFTGSSHPKLTGGTSRVNNLTIGNGAVACSLSIAKNIVVYGDLLIGGNGVIYHAWGKILYVNGDWTNNGTYSATDNKARVYFVGSNSTLTGATTFKDLRVNSGSTLTLGANITVDSDMDIYGVLNPTVNYSVSGSADLDVERDGVIQVHTQDFSSNYPIGDIDISNRSEINYASATITQYIDSSFRYGRLRISGGSTKEINADLIDLYNNHSTAGVIYLDAGILDLKSFTADRAGNGGTFIIASGAELWIGGTNSFPANYGTKTISPTSLVRYYGNNQTVEDLNYGHLELSGTSGVVVKTMPSTTLDILGNFTMEVGDATSVSATAGSNVSVSLDVLVDEDCTFDGATYTHEFHADFANEGTFTGNASTVQFTGVGAQLTGSGTTEFFNVSFQQVGISAESGMDITAGGDVETVSGGTFTHGSASIFEMSGASKTIGGSGFTFADLEVSGSTTTAEDITITGDFTVDGTFAATNNSIFMTGVAAIAGTGSLTFTSLEILGTITTDRDFTMEENLSIATTASLVASAGDVTFDGVSSLSGTAELYDVSVNATKTLNMGTNAIIKIGNTFSVDGTFNSSPLVPNTVIYNKNGNQTVTAETYFNLILAEGGTKSLGGAVVVNNDFTINSGVTFDGLTSTLQIHRHWNNNGTFTASTSDVQFVGSNSATLTGASTFYTLTVDKSSANIPVNLDNNMSATNITMTDGYMQTGANSVTTTSTRTGSGIIIGTIVHDHAISDGVTYYFEGPSNGLTFYNPSALNEVTVKVTLGEVTNVDPLVESVTREYDVDIPSGTYDSATLQLHYENNELNAFVEPYLSIYEWNTGTTWDSLGYDGRDQSANYVYLGGISDVDGIFILSGVRNIVRWNGTVSTDWDDADNWTTVSGQFMTSRVPDSLDVAWIGDTLFTNQPTLSTSETVNVVRFGDVTASTVTFSGGKLEIIGSARGNWSSNVSHIIDVADDSLIVGTNLTLSDGVIGHDIDLKIDDGYSYIDYDITQSGSGKVTFSSAGELAIAHSYQYSAGTFTPSTGTVIYTGNRNQSVAPLSYYNLNIDKSTGRASAESPMTVGNDLTTLTGGEFAILDTLTVVGDITIGASTEVIEFNSCINIGGDWVNNGSFTVSGGIVNFNGTANQSVDGTTFNNLHVTKTGGELTLTDDLYINNALRILDGTMDVETHQADRTATGGNLELASGGELRIGGLDNFPNNFQVVSIDTNSTVTYDGSVAQNVLALTYGNLVFSNGSPNEKTFEGSVTVLNDLTINTTAEISPDTANITLYGSFSNSGTYNPGSSNLILKGSSKTFTGSTTLNSLTVDGSYTVVSATVEMAGNLFIETTGDLDFGSNTAILDGDLTNSGTLTSNGIATFTGDQVQHISLLNAISSSSSGIINFNGTVEPVISSTSSPQFATVNVNNTAGITPSVPWNIVVALNIDASASFNAGALDHTIYGNFTNDGQVFSSGKLLFKPGAPYSASATIQLDGDSLNSTGEIEFAGTGPITLTDNAPVLNNVTISNTNSSGVTAPGSWEINGNLQIASGSEFKGGSGTEHIIEGDMINAGTMTGQSSRLTFSGDTSRIQGIGTNDLWDLKVDTSTVLILENAIDIKGDLVNDGELETDGSEVSFVGIGNSIISGQADTTKLSYMVSNKTGGATTTLSMPVVVLEDLTLTSGVVHTSSSNLLILVDNAVSSSGNANSFVQGPMRKIGDEAFTFPLGNDTIWARLAISAPSDSTHAFEAEYFRTPYSDTTTMAVVPTPVLNNVSTLEYWTCDRVAGSSNVTVQLFWENKYLSGIDSASADLVVARWNGSAWENAGQSAISGLMTGSVTSVTVSSFSPFTFGSTLFTLNQLPVEFVEFTARLNALDQVDLLWTTANEHNNDYFTIERSLDGEAFTELFEVDGAGNSTQILNYVSMDPAPVVGMNYYRLKQTDFDGSYSYSKVVSVELLGGERNFSIFPNPTSSEFVLSTDQYIEATLEIVNMQGAVLIQQQFSGTEAVVDLSELQAGVYYLRIKEGRETRQFKVIRS